VEEVMEEFSVTREQIMFCISRQCPFRPRVMQRPPMLILFDHGAPRSIARWLHGHTVIPTIARGWDRLAKGALLKAAEEAGFDLLLPTDKDIQYQQNLKGRRIAIVILGNSQRPAVHRYIDRVVAAVNAATPGSYAEVEIPYQ
jgi:hypothetical protein